MKEEEPVHEDEASDVVLGPLPSQPQAKPRPLSIGSLSSLASKTSDSGPDCAYYANPGSRHHQRRPHSKLQPSPSSASSHSNTSSLFRDDGFEDDLASTNSEHLSTTTTSTSSYALAHSHRLSFRGSPANASGRRQRTRPGPWQYLHDHHRHQPQLEDADEYRSCCEDFSQASPSVASNYAQSDVSSSLAGATASAVAAAAAAADHSTTTATTTSTGSTTTTTTNTTSSSQHLLNNLSLADAKQQYRKSLLLEHQQHQHLLHAQHVGPQTRIQSLLVPAPSSACFHLSQHQANSQNSLNHGSAGSPTPNKQTKCDDRTVNIIGHMPTKSPGYWDPNLSVAQRVVTEIIETERTYVDDLEQIVTGYICYLRNVLKKQKQNHESQRAQQQQQQQQRSCAHTRLGASAAPHVISEMVSRASADYDDNSLLVFEDDATSATNEVVDEDEDVDELETETAMMQAMSIGQVHLNHEHDHLHHHQHHLHHLDHHFAATNSCALMTASHIKKLFSNLEEIYKFNKDLLFRLEECYLYPSSVAECFVENAAGFEVYTHYCTMYPQVVSTLTELMANPTSSQLLKERQNELNQSLPLGAYLLKPVQRILKYHILFQSLIKHTANDETVNEKDRQLINEAFSVMTSIASHINSMKKRNEHAIRVQEVQGLLSGWIGPDLTTLGELILEDSFKIHNRSKSSRHLFLFDNILLITKKKRDGSLFYKEHIACSNLMLIENIDGQPLVFSTVPFDNPKALSSFQAKNLDKKRDWCIQMKEVIIKSFEVKIPVHVRDILMSLTNSNSMELGSKTSSECTKGIRALNYLEKKRSKQDKRK